MGFCRVVDDVTTCFNATNCHCGMVRRHQTWNLEIPDAMLRIASE
jgi:hypothetical protein